MAAVDVETVSASHSTGISETPFSGSEGIYLLPHNNVEIERLQRQHEFIKTACDGKQIIDQLLRGAKVLDSGCADGTWLVDLNKAHAGNLNVYGVDLGESLFQRHASLDLRAHDIRTPFPESWGWKNYFDLVHQRWLVWGIQKSEWQSVVHNLVDAVKPGGKIQIVEAQWILDHVPDDLPEQKKLNLVQTWSCESAGLDLHIWSRLGSLLEAEGIQDIEVISYDLGYGITSKREEDRIWTAELLPESFRHLAHQMKAEDGIPGVAKTAEEYFSWLERLVVEMKTKGYTPKVKWVTGRKPL
ncbi:putative methyltransferase [Bisporella sp. PMI_857]|nr:putative methyltransferase [Bisporella sp. PMI_857]